MTITKKICPNFTKGRKSYDYIVIHWFGTGTLESANTRFQNKDNQVSAHYGISNNTIYQWVEEENTAYHAGVWDINQRSIGIEHDATTDHDASEETYKNSAQLIKEICQRHNIPIDRDHIKGHNEFKATQCPGTINIDKLIILAKNGIIPDMEESVSQIIIDLIIANGVSEGDIRWLIDLKANQTVSNLEKQLEYFKDLKQEYEVERQELLAEISEYQKLESDWQSSDLTAKKQIEKLNKQIQTLEEELQIFQEEAKKYKGYYENALKDQVNKYSAWELIKLGLHKLFIKK